MYRILTIDGGGIAGISVSHFIKNIEEHLLLNEKISSYFDGFAGTSTGAIIAAGLALGYSGKEIYEMYENNIKHIFTSTFFRKINPFVSKYDNKVLIEVLKKYFGDTLMTDLKTRLYIPTTNIKNATTKVWDNNDSIPVWYAVLTSCSAPTYFPVVDGIYCDGALWGNNPVLVGSLGFKRDVQVPMKLLSVMSIGTSCHVLKENPISNRMTKLDWLPVITNFLTTGNEQSSNFYASELDLGQYYRLQPTIETDFTLDDLSKINYLNEIWYSYYELQKDKLDTYFKKKSLEELT